MKDLRSKEEIVSYLEEYRELVFRQSDIEEQMFSFARLLRETKDDESQGKVQKRVEAFRRRLQEKLIALQYSLVTVSFRRKRIERVVAALPPSERAVIDRYYISGDHRGAAEELMEELGYEKSQIYRLRENGLRRIGRLLLTLEDESSLFSEEQADEKA